MAVDNSREIDFGGANILANNFTISNAAGKVSGLADAAPVLRYVVKNVNFNSAATDTAVNIVLPATLSGSVLGYVVDSVRITNASASISTATIGVFGATGGGSPTIAADQAITVTATAAATNNNTMKLTLTNADTEYYTATTLYVRVGTGQGSAATADVNIYLRLLD